MRRREFCKLAGTAAIGLHLKSAPAESGNKAAGASRWLLDMVHVNPGEKPPQTAFLDPRTLSAYGYSGQVVMSVIEGVPTFGQLDPQLIPDASAERAWAEETALKIQRQIEAAHAAGLKCFAWMQIAVLPKALVAKYKSEICDPQGRIDPVLPMTQKILRMQIAEIFDRLPKLDGLLIRTGEVYLHDLPYHASTDAPQQQKTQGSSAILHGEESHRALLRILREGVCVARRRMVFYRTWDFGNNFHNNPAYYLRVTDAIEPHPNLIFSIKHQKGDFHQLTPFNPTLMIGRHRQIVEVQCQREAYGKGAHPYYIGNGVIEGWEEMDRLMKLGEPRGLRDIIHHPLYAGTWTWSRGGGWDGPSIVNEQWCALNAYVLCKFSEDPSRTEPEILALYARSIGLCGEDVPRFCEMQDLSAKAVLRGQLTNLGAEIDLWWTRDDKLGDPDLSDFLRRGLVEQAIAEKSEACALWRRIVEIATQIRWKNAAMRGFVITSAHYGAFKYEVIRQGWTVLLLGRQGDAAGHYDSKRISEALAAYDAAWQGWRELHSKNASCATLYKDVGFGDKPGLGAAVNRYRKLT
ncbi:MAG: hypothetical protein WAN35_20370 [Terracidiphilus sp.]